MFLGGVLGNEFFLADIVPAFIAAKINVAAREHLLDDFLHRLLVPGLSGANEIIIADFEFGPQVFKNRRISIRPIHDRTPTVLG